MSAETQRKAYRYNCNMIRPQLYSEKSLMESVVDFFSDVVPQAYSPQKVEDKEKIQWVRFENCDCSDIARNPDLFKYDTKGLPLLLILGYSNGVQIWHITPNGEALEILSIRQGPVKICRILPNPEPVLGYTDSFSSKRPLIVMCDSSSAGQPFCGMKFVSLKTGDEVHSVSFKTLPVHNIECNKRFLVATFLEKVCVYEACRFKQLFWITSCYPCPGSNVNPIALSSRWLAYADRRLVPMHQSCGGMSGDGTQSYAATVISAAKGAFKGLSMFGEAMVNSMTGCKPSTSKKQQDYVQLDNGNRPGIVSVVDIQNIHNDHFNVNEDNEGSGLIAHFHAHANEPVADMAFDPTGTLLVTACKLGHNFHIFRLMAHPCSSSLGAVHHLYTLHRGDTTAKVIDIGFNHDSRWVTVSTHRGTTHVFAITPYGGIPNVRTHCQPFVVNRASRFHRSAGLEDIEHSPLGRRSPVLSTSPGSSGHYDRYPSLIQQNTLNNNMGHYDRYPSLIQQNTLNNNMGHYDRYPSLIQQNTLNNNMGHYDRYPSLIQQNTLNNNMGNPRLPPYPHPITVYPLFQVKQPLNVVLNPANKNMSPNHSPTGVDNVFAVASKFCTPRLCVVGSPKLDVERREAGKRPVDCLFIMAQSGTLVEYVLEPRARSVSEKVHDESMLELNVVGRMQWNLQRLKTSSELRPPLPTNSPLILSHEAVVSQVQTSPEYYDLPGLTRHDSKDSLSSDHSGKDEDEWVSQVEIITHAGPHRRLWMGPQFSFKTYQENTTVLSSHSSSLLSQSSETNMVAMDITGEEGDLESLRVQPTRSNPVSMPNARPAYRRLSSDSSPSPGLSGHAAPLLIEAGSFDQSPHLLDVYSNWTESTVEKQPRGSDDIEEDKIKETLADAIVGPPIGDSHIGSFDQSPHLLDVYSNWTESTVEKQPRGSDDIEEDKIKETLADAMVESPMRDMEKLSFRQDSTKADGRKEKTDSGRKKKQEAKEMVVKEKNQKNDTKEKKLEKKQSQSTKQDKKQSQTTKEEEQFAVKSESNIAKSQDKGRTQTLVKNSAENLACASECSSDRLSNNKDKKSVVNKKRSDEKVDQKSTKETTPDKPGKQSEIKKDGASKNNNDSTVNDKTKSGKKKGKSKAANNDNKTTTKVENVEKGDKAIQSEDVVEKKSSKVNIINTESKHKSSTAEIDVNKKNNAENQSKSSSDGLLANSGKSDKSEDSITASKSERSEENQNVTDKENGSYLPLVNVKGEATNKIESKEPDTKKSEESMRVSISPEKIESKKNGTGSETKEPGLERSDRSMRVTTTPDKAEGKRSESKPETKQPDTKKSDESIGVTITPDKQEGKKNGGKKQKKGKGKQADMTKSFIEESPSVELKSKQVVEKDKSASNNGEMKNVTETRNDANISLTVNMEQDTNKQTEDSLNANEELCCIPLDSKHSLVQNNPTGPIEEAPKLPPEENIMEASTSQPEVKEVEENVWAVKEKKKKQRKPKPESQKDQKSTQLPAEDKNVVGNSKGKEIVESIYKEKIQDESSADIEETKHEKREDVIDQESEKVKHHSEVISEKENDSPVVPKDLETPPYSYTCLDLNNIMCNNEIQSDIQNANIPNTVNIETVESKTSESDICGKLLEPATIETQNAPKDAEVDKQPITSGNKKQKKKKKDNKPSKPEKAENRPKEDDEVQHLPSNRNKKNDVLVNKETVRSGNKLEEQIDVVEKLENMDVAESMKDDDDIEILTESKPISDKGLSLGNLEIPFERTDSLERSPSFESVRSTFSEERGQMKTDGTDSELLASTEQSDNDMIEVKSKKKRRKKKNGMEESLYFEASEPGVPVESKSVDQEVEVIGSALASLDVQSEKQDESAFMKSNEFQDKIPVNICQSVEVGRSNDSGASSKINEMKAADSKEEQDLDNEMFVVKSKKNRKNKKSQIILKDEQAKELDENASKISEPTHVPKFKEHDNANEQEKINNAETETDCISTDATPVNSEEQINVSKLTINLKSPTEDAAAWETVAKSKSNESQNNDEELDTTKSGKSDAEEKAVDKKEVPKDSKNSTEASNSSSRSSEERDAENPSSKPSASETKSKKKRKKNRK